MKTSQNFIIICINITKCSANYLTQPTRQLVSSQPTKQQQLTAAAAVELSSNHNLDNERQHWRTAKCQSQLMFSRGKTTTGKTSGQQRNLLPYFIDQYFVVGASIFRTNNIMVNTSLLLSSLLSCRVWWLFPVNLGCPVPKRPKGVQHETLAKEREKNLVYFLNKKNLHIFFP